MIKFTKLLREIEEQKQSNVAAIDDESQWKWTDIDHICNMQFKRDGDTTFVMDNPPMKVYKIKDGPFVVEEPAENHERPNVVPGQTPAARDKGKAAFSSSKRIIKKEFTSFIKLLGFFDEYDQFFGN